VTKEKPTMVASPSKRRMKRTPFSFEYNSL